MAYFRAHPETGVTRPEQVAVVGDRLSTDVVMANLMGGYGVWVKDGVVGEERIGFVSLSFLSFNFLLVVLFGTRHVTL
jgi:phosphatidylglycerophosphatase GEP4